MVNRKEIYMGIRNLTDWNDPIFRKISRAVEKFDERLWNLLEDMRECLQFIDDGKGFFS